MGERVGDARPIGLRERFGDDVRKCGRRPVAEEQLPKRRERADLAARPAPRDQHARIGRRCEELLDEPRLALTGRTGHECEHRARLRPPLGDPEQLELGVATDEWQTPAAGRPADLVEGPDLQPAEPLEVDVPECGERRDLRRRLVRDRTDEHLPRLGPLLKPRRGVHDSTHTHLLLRIRGGGEVDDRLAGLEADPHPERDLGRGA